MQVKPALLLLPNLLGETKHHEVYLPSSVDHAVETIDGLIAESERAGRRFLSLFKTKKSVREMPIAVYNDRDIDFLLEPIRQGERWGFISDAGIPCVADPGGKLVRRAKQTGIVVQAFVGPSSIFLALMLSGLDGQRFAFHGYLPKDGEKRVKTIKQLDKLQGTQIFIETPYRNQQTFEMLIENLNSETSLCVAWDLTLPTQGVLTHRIAVWKKSPMPNLVKRNAIYLIGSVLSN